MSAATGGRLVYVLDRFPADTLNFIYNEVRILEEQGFAVELYSLMPAVNCPDEARGYLGRTETLRPVPIGDFLVAWGHYALRRPLALIRLAAELLADADGPRRRFKTLAHLAVGVVFAWRVRGRRDHVHAHFAFKAATAALCAARLNGASFSFTAHGSATVHEPGRYSLRAKTRAARFVVAVSEFNRRTLLELCPELPEDRVVVNRTGVLLAQFPPAPLSPPLSPRRLLCVATLYPIKNHEGLLRACALLAERGIDFRLDLAGRDVDGRRARLEALAAELGVTARVRFHGVVDHGEVARLIEAAEVVVLSSLSEGVPVSLMEAMARGRPVVGPRVTGVAELVEDGVAGLLTDPGDPRALADALASIFADGERARAMAAAGRARIEADYDMVKNAKRLAGLFAARSGCGPT